jgi:hypothetical protein
MFTRTHQKKKSHTASAQNKETSLYSIASTAPSSSSSKSSKSKVKSKFRE